MIKMSFFLGFPPMFLAQMMIHLQNYELPSMPFFFFLWFFSNIFVFVSVPWLVLLSFYLFLFFLFSSFRKCVTMTSRNDFIKRSLSIDRSIDICDHLLYIRSIFNFISSECIHHSYLFLIFHSSTLLLMGSVMQWS
jgi:hypothetical protein